MWSGYSQRSRPVRRIGRLGILAAFTIGLVLLVRTLGAAPANQAEAEAQLERPILAYAVLDDVPYVVFSLDGKVYLDYLVLDWIAIDWPPAPRWQWTGNWSAVAFSNAPASVAIGDPHGNPVLFGQVNATEIVKLQVEVEGQWRDYPVSGAGFAVALVDNAAYPTRYRWLDAYGNVVIEADQARTAGP